MGWAPRILDGSFGKGDVENDHHGPFLTTEPLHPMGSHILQAGCKSVEEVSRSSLEVWNLGRPKNVILGGHTCPGDVVRLWWFENPPADMSSTCIGALTFWCIHPDKSKLLRDSKTSNLGGVNLRPPQMQFG